MDDFLNNLKSKIESDNSYHPSEGTSDFYISTEDFSTDDEDGRDWFIDRIIESNYFKVLVFWLVTWEDTIP